MSKRSIEIFTDGGARPQNPGEGVYAFSVMEKNVIVHEEANYCGFSTSNIMELTAAIKSLEWCLANGYKDDILYVTSDSQYLQKGITEWVPKWLERKWKTGNRKPVANQDLWMKLIELKNQLNVTFQWVRGHSGVPGNERVDQMCTKLLDEMLGEDNKKDIIDDKN